MRLGYDVVKEKSPHNRRDTRFVSCSCKYSLPAALGCVLRITLGTCPLRSLRDSSCHFYCGT